MNKKLLVALSLITGQTIAMEPMEMTIDIEKATTTDTTEKKVVIQIQDQEREVPTRFIPLIGTLKNPVEDLTEAPKENIPLPKVSLATWQLIENQLERIYQINQGNQQVRSKIVADYKQLDKTKFIDLIKAIDYLDIPLLRDTTMDSTLEVVQNNLTYDEIVQLPEYMRNEVIKRKVHRLQGPVVLKEIAVCRGHYDEVNSVCVTPDGKIVSGSEDKTVRIWDMKGQELAVCKGHKAAVWSVCVTSDNRIVSVSGDGTVRIWDMNGQELAICRGCISSVCFTKDNKIVSGSDNNTVRIWDIDGKELAVCRGHEDKVMSVCITSNNKIVSGSWDKTVRIWDMNGHELAICRGHEGFVESVCVTPDGKIVSGSYDGTARIWDMNGQELAVCRGHEDRVTSACGTQDNKIVSCSHDKTVRIWDMNGQELAVCQGHENWVLSVCITSNNKIVSSSWDDTVRIWDMNGHELAICRGHKGFIESVCVTPDGKIVSHSSGKFNEIVGVCGIDLLTFSHSPGSEVRIWDINLLNRLSSMNAIQAQAICKILQSSPYSSREEQEQCWKAIWNIIFEEEEIPVKSTSWCTLL